MAGKPRPAALGAGDRVAVDDPALNALSNNEGVVAEVRDDGAVLVTLAGVGTFPFAAESVRLRKRAPAAVTADLVAVTEEAAAEPKRQVWAGEDVTYHHVDGDRPAMVLRFKGFSRADLILDFEGMQFEGSDRLDLAVANGSAVLNVPEGAGPGQWSRPST